jgi:GNAT superfamily N-acetyltransferase
MPPLQTRRILVIANETVESAVLHDVIRARVEYAAGAEVTVVAPALNSRLRHWLSDDGDARLAAEERLDRCLGRLIDDGVEASGWVGDADPVQAIEDALHVFAADEIAVATHPEGRSNWLARDLVRRARERFPQPVLHIVVDSERNHEYVAGSVRTAA